ncbi:MAG: tetratricopeptide repeat protein [Bacteroidota bacterium]
MKKSIFIYFTLSCIGLLLYSQAIKYGFVRDDTFHLLKNPYLQNISFSNIKQFWVDSYWRLYIPVTYTTWAILKPIGDLFTSSQALFNSGAYHLLNILIHILNSILVYKLLQLIVKNRNASFIGALFFLLHPIQIESVAWISELRGVLSTFWGLLFLFMHISKNKETTLKKRMHHYIIQYIFLLLAVTSKPTAIAFPVIAFIFDYLYFKKPLKTSIYLFLPSLIVIIPVSIITVLVQPGDEQSSITAPLWMRPFILSDSINFYLQKILWPHPLATSYGRTNNILMNEWWFYLSPVIPISVLFFTIKQYRRHPLVLIAFLVFIAGFLPVSGIIRHAYQSWSNVADRFIYFSIFGFSVILAYGLSLKKTSEYLFYPSIILLVAYFFYGKFYHVPIWKNSVTLWTHNIKHFPEEPRSYLCLADKYAEQDKTKKAIDLYTKGLDIKKDAAGYNSRGNAYASLGNYKKALNDYNISISLDSNNVNTYNNRGILYYKNNQFNKAKKDLYKSIQMAPEDYRPYLNLGNCYLKQNKTDSARWAYQLGIERNPQKAILYYNIGKIYNQQNNYPKALEYFKKSALLNPDLKESYFYSAMIHFKQKNYKEVIILLSKYLALDPDHKYAYVNRAKAYFFTGHYHKAYQDIVHASKLNAQIDKNFLNAVLSKVK